MTRQAITPLQPGSPVAEAFADEFAKIMIAVEARKRAAQMWADHDEHAASHAAVTRGARAA